MKRNNLRNARQNIIKNMEKKRKQGNKISKMLE